MKGMKVHYSRSCDRTIPLLTSCKCSSAMALRRPITVHPERRPSNELILTSVPYLCFQCLPIDVD